VAVGLLPQLGNTKVYWLYKRMGKFTIWLNNMHWNVRKPHLMAAVVGILQLPSHYLIQAAFLYKLLILSNTQMQTITQI
jgi:hypothetical protein